MDKKKLNPLARFRGFIQAGATLLTNIHLPNFAKGTLYQGNGKYVCVPGLNCFLEQPDAAQTRLPLDGGDTP